MSDFIYQSMLPRILLILIKTIPNSFNCFSGFVNWWHMGVSRKKTLSLSVVSIDWLLCSKQIWICFWCFALWAYPPAIL